MYHYLSLCIIIVAYLCHQGDGRFHVAQTGVCFIHKNNYRLRQVQTSRVKYLEKKLSQTRKGIANEKMKKKKRDTSSWRGTATVTVINEDNKNYTDIYNNNIKYDKKLAYLTTNYLSQNNILLRYQLMI